MQFDTTATQLQGVLAVARRLAATGDEQEVLDAVCLTVRRHLSYGSCVLSLRGADGHFKVAAASGLEEKLEATLRGLVVSAGAFEALSHAALRSGQVHLVPPHHPVRRRGDVRAGLLTTGVSVSRGSWQEGTMLFVPLVGRDGETMGFLNPDDPLSGELPSDQEVLLLEAIADLAVLGIELARARSDAAAATTVMEAQGRQLEALMMTGAQVRGGVVLDEVLREMAVAMTAAGGFNRAAIYLVGEGESLECRATVGLPAEEDEELRRTPLTVAEFRSAMLPEMQISRSYFFDHRRFVLPPEVDAKLAATRVEREWREGQWHPEDMLTVPMHDADGELLGIVSLDDSATGRLPDRVHVEALEFFADQCAAAVVHSRRFEAVRTEAQTDPLTGLANRRALEELIELSVHRYDHFGEPACLLFIDIDHFKDVNDTFGHAVGDLVLQRVGAALRERLRRGDLLARYGGEEVVALLPDSTLEAGTALGESLRARVESLDLSEVSGEIPIRISVGVASVTPDRMDVESLLSSADAAMYRAKRDGRNRVASAA